MRRLITEIVAEDPTLEVVGTAANGRIALLKVDQLNPDVVTLDVEMPEMDGLECLRRLRQTHPKLPVIMFSTITERCASATLDALALGANDYVTKPSKVASVSAGWEHVRQQLLPKIRHFGAASAAMSYRWPDAPGSTTAASRATSSSHQTAATPTAPARLRIGSIVQPQILSIGVSTGGPNALSTLLPLLPEDLAVPIVIVQHMPPMFTKMLAERLSGLCRFPVTEVVDSEPIHPGRAYLAPGDHHMTVERHGTALRVRINQEAPENYCRPAVDVLFRSVVKVFGGAVLGLVLTGMGQDGLRGSAAIKEAGGRILIQDQASSVVWGMPGAVHDAGLADGAYPLDRLAAEVLSAVGRGTSSAKGKGFPPGSPNRAAASE